MKGAGGGGGRGGRSQIDCPPRPPTPQEKLRWKSPVLLGLSKSKSPFWVSTKLSMIEPGYKKKLFISKMFIILLYMRTLAAKYPPSFSKYWLESQIPSRLIFFWKI